MIHSPFETINDELNECIASLERFMSEESQQSLSAETTAVALSTTHDIATMQKLEETSASFSNTAGIAQKIRTKRELQSIKQRADVTEQEMIKYAGNLQQSAMSSGKSVMVTTYSEGAVNQLRALK
jgi:hypothetical protein